MAFDYFPIFEFEDILLREIHPEFDKEDFLKYMVNEEIAKFLDVNDIPYDIESSRKELEYWHSLFHVKYSFYWGIAEKSTNKLIGTCGFNHWLQQRNMVDISYDLDYKYWGKGIMTKALERLMLFGKIDLGVKLARAKIVQSNHRSINLIKRLNFEYSYTEDKPVLIGSNYHKRDVYMREY